MKSPVAYLFLAMILVVSCQPSQSDFVTVRNGQFHRKGDVYRFMGANYWQGMNLGGNTPDADPARLRRELDQMKAIGITNLRIMALTEGPDNSRYRILPAVQDEPGVLKEELLVGLDVLLDEMKKRDMTAVVVLNNFWQWSGGMGQYVKWHTGDTIPYPPPHWNGDWYRFMQYVARFYTLPEATTQFNESITRIISRKNTVSGILYRDDPTIMSWELANEPRGIDQVDAMHAWIESTSRYIKSLDRNHLVTTGAEGYTSAPESSGTDFVRMHDYPSIDYATVHIWIQNWGWYDPEQHEQTYPGAKQKMTDYLKRHVEESKILGKPLVLEEFGIMRDNGSFDPESSAVNRDLYYSDVFEQVYQYALKGGISGVNFWAWGGEGRPRQPAAWWKKGDPFTGDPPHEPQGWYSVYDHDHNTHSTIKNFSDKLNGL
jgi:mannan endo-1,4-beta-mannosidase